MSDKHPKTSADAEHEKDENKFATIGSHSNEQQQGERHHGISELYSATDLATLGDSIDSNEYLTRSALFGAKMRRSRLRAWNPTCGESVSRWNDTTTIGHDDDSLPFEVTDLDRLSVDKDRLDSFDDSSDGDLEVLPGEEENVDCQRSASSDEDGNRLQYTHAAASDSKYTRYSCMVDASQHDRSVQIRLSSLERPHMRAFHLAWTSLFVAFFTWFALTPLLSEVQRSLHLSREQVWTSSVYAVAGSAVTRILIGPLCDKYGARWAMAGTLVVCAIPMAFAAAIQTATGLYILRLVIGVAGSAFVTCQYWTATMFTVEVVGTANALVAGWGNLGGGVTQVVMGSMLFPLFKTFFGGRKASGYETHDSSADLAWRTVCVIPAILCFVVAYFVVRHADDSPKGNYSKRSRQGFIPRVSAERALQIACTNVNTWILFIQYGCCFGVEITVVNGAALYFKEVFGVSTEVAAAIASIFGWMNLFARGVGGFASDLANARKGMRGRLWVQTITLFVEGALIVAFGQADTMGLAIFVMVVFSIFVQAAEGSTFGIVPYLSPSVTGSVAGVVGAGGTCGGVLFAAVFRENDYQKAFRIMGFVVMGSALLTFLVCIHGHATLCGGQDAPEILERRINRREQLGSLPAVSMHESDDSRRESISSNGGGKESP